MKLEQPKMPNPNAIQELRERFYRIKKDNQDKKNKLIDLFRKKDQDKKSAKDQRASSDLDI